VASAYLDSTPSVFIFGQVQTYLMKGDRPVRQYAFQECDVVAMARDITKAAWRARSADEAVQMFEDALVLAKAPRPGPVVLEIPSDVLSGVVTTTPSGPRGQAASGDPAAVRRHVVDALAGLAAAERPLVLLGGGVNVSGASRTARDAVHALRVPAVSTLTALDVLDADDVSRVGLIGMYGNRWANHAISEADCVLVLGSKLDFGTIGADTRSWAANKSVYQVDCDEAETRRVRGARVCVTDLAGYLTVALEVMDDRQPTGVQTAWTTHIATMRRRWPDTAELPPAAGINPNELMRVVSRASERAHAYVIDAGQHLWWACQSLQPRAGQRILPAVGLGPCGWALPAAVGVALASQGPVVLIIGDGSLQFNIQELQTVKRNSLPIKIVVVNNHGHGSVRQLQEALFEGRYPASVEGYDAPDFVKVAEAYGLRSRAVDAWEDVADALTWLWDNDEASLLDVHIAQELNVFPNVAFGRQLSQMDAADGGAGRSDGPGRVPVATG